MKKVMWQANKGSLQLTTSKSPTAYKELKPVNNHMSWEAGPAPSELQMRPKPGPKL